MFTTDDLVDAILETLAFPKAGEHVPPSPEHLDAKLPKGRLFLSEYDVKKRLVPGARSLAIPGNAIISPLALDWLELRGIRIVRE